MANKQPELSEEMYKRIYRLIKREIDPRIIANTLNIPLRTIEAIITRLEKNSTNDYTNEPLDNTGSRGTDKGFLDIYLYTKTRYAIIQLVGTLITDYLESFSNELEKAHNSTFKAFAIRMSDVTSIDETAGKLLLNSYEKFQSLHRFMAILDPSPDIDRSLTLFHIDSTIPVFGTERAFEDAAFTRKTTIIKRNSS